MPSGHRSGLRAFSAMPNQPSSGRQLRQPVLLYALVRCQVRDKMHLLRRVRQFDLLQSRLVARIRVRVRDAQVP
jgi:hypothetical protein